MPVLWVVAYAFIFPLDTLIGELSETSLVIFLVDFLDF